VKSLIKLIDDGGERLKALHITNWGDVRFAPEIINESIAKILG
jgi:hypothetical protein